MRSPSPVLLLLKVTILLLVAGPAMCGVVISEFMASNGSGLSDEDGDEEDWIEILNDSVSAVDLAGWRLSDEAGNNAKWVFPSRTLQPGELLVVFASSKDRAPVGGELHTNFRLAAAGEYLGLFDGNGVVVHEYAPAFPLQVTDVSYGLPSDKQVSFLEQGAACEVGVPVSQGDYDTNFVNWKTSIGSYGGSSWQAGAHTGVGYDENSTYGTLIGAGGDIGGRLNNFQRTACLRVPFTVDDPAEIESLRLRMKWDDGFIAYINGTEVASDLAPASPAWNSLSAGNRTEALNNDWTDFEIPVAGVALNAGTNILALHGFNQAVSSSDFLLLPVLDGTLVTSAGNSVPTWFTNPTPGVLNGAGGTVGPVLEQATSVIPRPTGSGGSPSAVISVRVSETVFPVASVRAYHRTMFGSETQVTLNDAGSGPDLAAGDGVYSGTLLTGGPLPGQMLRWRFEALDDQGNATTDPPYIDPADNDRYFGTVALDPDTGTSLLPVLHWFISDPSAAGTRGGTRASFFFLDEFYDNVQVDLHGQSTSGFAKKSHDIDFNAGNRFRWKPGESRVKDINLLTNYADRTKTRNTLSHEMGMHTGTVHHFCFPVRVEQNGSFHGVWDMMEDADDRMMERNGWDPNGAFYKMYNSLDSSAGSAVEKKTRLDEDHSDLQALITGLDPARSLTARRTYAYDNLNLPATVNYLVTRQFNSDRDHGHKNYFVYRDSEGSGEWQPIVWDVDLSHGHNWGSGSGYFDDVLRWNNPLNAGSLGNRLYNLVFETPELRAMFLRRMRTLMDDWLQPPGTVNGILETRMREIAAAVDPDPGNPSSWTDGDRDFSRWGTWGAGLRCREEVERVISGYLAPRRTFLFDQNVGTRPTLGGDPIPDQPQANTPGMVLISEIDYLPVAGTQQEEYIQLRNLTPVAVDISGWRLSGAVDHVFQGGTVIPEGPGSQSSDYQGLLHVVKHAPSFRARASGPRGGQRRLIQGDYSGQLSARGETIELRDASGALMATRTYAGSPTVLQESLRITEISYNPAPPSAAELLAMPGINGSDFEFIELMNISGAMIDLTGAHFTNGLTFTFPAGSLGPGQRVVVAKNPAALGLRYGTLPVTVFGPWDGELDGAGERLELSDPVGEVILDFTFKDGWYPATDGPGRSLVARDPQYTPHDFFGEAEAWAISLGEQGSPGNPDPVFAEAYYGWDNWHFDAAERADPLISGPEADPDGDGRVNLFEYLFGTDPRVADGGGVGFEWAEVGGSQHAALRFRRPVHAIDLIVELLAGDDPMSWPVVADVEHEVVPAGGERETVVLREAAPATGPARFLRLRVGLR